MRSSSEGSFGSTQRLFDRVWRVPKGSGSSGRSAGRLLDWLPCGMEHLGCPTILSGSQPLRAIGFPVPEGFLLLGILTVVFPKMSPPTGWVRFQGRRVLLKGTIFGEEGGRFPLRCFSKKGCIHHCASAFISRVFLMFCSSGKPRGGLSWDSWELTYPCLRCWV